MQISPLLNALAHMQHKPGRSCCAATRRRANRAGVARVTAKVLTRKHDRSAVLRVQCAYRHGACYCVGGV
jgi:hypothetical protein